MVTWADKWSQIDDRKTAHWWIGSAGTACGIDFRRFIHRAYASTPRCQKCVEYLNPAEQQ